MRELRWLGAFSGILRLLFASGPAAVAGLVIAVVIDAVYRMTGWTLAHVSDEAREAVGPAVTDGDSSLIAAVAAAKPARPTFSFLVGSANNDKSFETLASAIYEGGSHSQGVYYIS